MAQSGRALAQACAASGATPWVLDRFGDEETRAAGHWIGIGNQHRDTLSVTRARDALRRWRARARLRVVWGGGVEAQPALLALAVDFGEVLGSEPRFVARLAEPCALATTFRTLGIPYPEVRDTATVTGRWLRKRAAAAGGMHVHPYALGQTLRRGEYLQSFVEGDTYSCVFCATARGATVIGFNRLLNLQLNKQVPFRYSGAVQVELPVSLARACEDYAARLAIHCGWRGLCGFDFRSDGGQPWLIDFNPRPTATAELHLAPADLFAMHVAACEGRNIPLKRRSERAGHIIVYAPHPLRVPSQLEWPAWCADRPSAGTLIPAHGPVCSVMATGQRDASVVATLEARLAHLLAWTESWSLDDLF